MAIKIGITGGIGSGKSVVSRLLETMGVPVYISDVESKHLTVSDVQIRRELIALLGEEVYIGDELNKTLLASYIFGNPEHIRIVNGIIHPRVRDDFRRWVERHVAYPIVGMESAILIEAGFAGEVDAVVMVYAPEEIRIARAMQRDAAPRELVERRVRSQMSDEEKRTNADFVIVNDGETPLIPQVLEVITSLSKNIAYLCQPKK
ncbi:dephospho-CoA kinase [uncultured Bacteroides sp.]|uniref:dephospho-CoA kinase n=1 Tax=uncultured Bacteroides sp. TaxID=162156 RepID=UPI0025E608A1|nr:dephospho-CoA kinase [uncultured Bacteroides sp.]